MHDRQKIQEAEPARIPRRTTVTTVATAMCFYWLSTIIWHRSAMLRGEAVKLLRSFAETPLPRDCREPTCQTISTR
jgi:hypothetical protein